MWMGNKKHGWKPGGRVKLPRAVEVVPEPRAASMWVLRLTAWAFVLFCVGFWLVLLDHVFDPLRF